VRKIALVLSVLMLLTMLAGCVETRVPETEYDSSNQATASQDSVSSTTANKSESTRRTVPVDKLISEKKAEDIALKKAGVKSADVSRLEIDLDYDDDQKRWEYEVDFYVGKVEYEVDIHAETGEVVLFKKDDDTVSKATKPTTNPDSTEKPTIKTEAGVPSASSKFISKDRAKEIALDKAGVKESAITHYRIKTDYDDDRNRWEYEIDFYVGKVEYDVTIDAVKGTILEFEREDEEDKRKATATTKPKFITKDDVLSIALLCAGVNENKISNYETELDYDDDTKRWEYEVAFNVGRIEYDILINAVTGELIHWEKEIDD